MTTLSFPRLGACAALVALLAGALAPELQMKPGDHKKLGKEIAAWFKAKDESKGIDKAYLTISATVSKLEKKMGGKSALALVEDWEQAFFQARLGTLGKGIKARRGRVAEASAKLSSGGEADLAIFLPKSYSAKKGPYPLFLIVGDEGAEPLALLERDWTGEELRSKAILLAPRMPADTATWTEITVDGAAGGIATIMSLYGQVLRQFPIDMDRVYLVGYGAGAAAAGRVAGFYPQLFAGFAAVAAAPGIDATNFANLPTLAVGDGEGSAALASAVEELGYGNGTRADTATGADIWTWSVDKVRDPYPDKIIFAPQSPYTTSAHWLSVEGADVSAGPRVEAHLERDTNSIVVHAEKVESVQIYFNDLLVDMDKAVKVTINGVTKEGLVPRNKRLMLELNYNLGDWGRVFTNRQSYDVPLEQAK